MPRPGSFNKDKTEYLKRNPNVELSQQDGNPASAIRANYDMLMQIEDPVEMARAAVKVVKPLVGHGMSEENYKRFVDTLKKTLNKGLTGVMSYLSNYMLKADGQGVMEDIQSAMATMICESTLTPIRLTARQIENRNMCFRYKIHVGIRQPAVI